MQLSFLKEMIGAAPDGRIADVFRRLSDIEIAWIVRRVPADLLGHLVQNGAASLAQADPDEMDKGTRALVDEIEHGPKSMGELVRATRLTQPQLRYRLKRLLRAGLVFMVGDKRFARYGKTRELATESSRLARGLEARGSAAPSEPRHVLERRKGSAPPSKSRQGTQGFKGSARPSKSRQHPVGGTQ